MCRDSNHQRFQTLPILLHCRFEPCSLGPQLQRPITTSILLIWPQSYDFSYKGLSLYFPNFLTYSQQWQKRYFGIIKSELKYGFHIPLIKGYGTVIIANITPLQLNYYLGRHAEIKRAEPQQMLNKNQRLSVEQIMSFGNTCTRVKVIRQICLLSYAGAM